MAGEVVSGFTEAVARIIEAFGALAIFVAGGVFVAVHYHTWELGVGLAVFGGLGAFASLYYRTRESVVAELPVGLKVRTPERGGIDGVLEADLTLDDETFRKANWLNGSREGSSDR
ncbi:MAG: hypothetical protein ACYDHP_06300 [Ferrimicrobium sp.]